MRLRFPTFNERRAVAWAAGLTLLLCAAVLIGWAFHIATLKSILPSYITMKANTAIGLALLACGLLAVRSGLAGGRSRALAFGFFQLAVVLIAGLTLAEYLAGVNIGIDELVFLDPDGVTGKFPPGRLAPITAVNFILISVGALLSFGGSGRFPRTGQFLTCLAFLCSFQALVGYVTGVSYQFGSAYYTQMAIHTAVGTILVAGGYLFADLHRGFMSIFAADTVGGTVARRLIFGAMIVPPLVQWLQLQGQHLGWYDADFGTLLRVMGNVAFLSVLVWRTAWMLHESHLRTLELLERERHAQRSSRMKTEFLANMSHEIRTPINGVLGMTQLLLDTRLEAEQQEFAQTIRRSAEGLLTIINDVLDFSKVEAGKLELERIDFDLREVLREAMHAHKFAFRTKGLSLDLTFAGQEPVFVKGDPGRFRQVLQNLIANALKFTSVGGVTVRVTREEADYLFEVQDTGVGIPQETLGRLFQAFEQADTSTTRHFGGSGLGLSICRKLVNLMNGDIGVRSRVGEGSTFWFRVRFDASDRKAPVQPSVLRPEIRASRAARILVADDNAVNLLIAQRFLEKAGYRAHCVGSGGEVLSALRDFSFDLILMDCHMPEMDGFEATRLIRASETLGYREIPILALTASALPEERQACFDVGMNDHITKPVQYANLIAKIEEWLPPATGESAAG